MPRVGVPGLRPQALDFEGDKNTYDLVRRRIRGERTRQVQGDWRADSKGVDSHGESDRSGWRRRVYSDAKLVRSVMDGSA